mmetsp:Transcript_69571/g.201604  ORF Transcript_69571/g.201604 Transcript_69571/m.201604 type:complete len:613 (-) Transcript_69571:207-2045(-)
MRVTLFAIAACLVSPADARGGGRWWPKWADEDGFEKFKHKVHKAFDDVAESWNMKKPFDDSCAGCWSKGQRSGKQAKQDLPKVQRELEVCKTALAAHDGRCEEARRRIETMLTECRANLREDTSIRDALQAKLLQSGDARGLLQQRLYEADVALERLSRSKVAADDLEQQLFVARAACDVKWERRLEHDRRKAEVDANRTAKECDARVARVHAAHVAAEEAHKVAASKCERQLVGECGPSVAQWEERLEKAWRMVNQTAAECDARMHGASFPGMEAPLHSHSNFSAAQPHAPNFDMSWSAKIVLGVINCVLAVVVFVRFFAFERPDAFKASVHTLQKERDDWKIKATSLQRELEDELGGTIRVQEQESDLSRAFEAMIWDKKSGGETVRYIKICCPGVRHCDIEVDIIFNGCIVHIDRVASPGVKAMQWERRFQFRPTTLFEFKEDQAVLDRGFLHLVFVGFQHQARKFRFPQHYDLCASDFDQQYTFQDDGHSDQPMESAGLCVVVAEGSPALPPTGEAHAMAGADAESRAMGQATEEGLQQPEEEQDDEDNTSEPMTEQTEERNSIPELREADDGASMGSGASNAASSGFMMIDRSSDASSSFEQVDDTA